MNHANHVNHVNHRPLFFSQPACNHVNYCDHNLKKNAGTVTGGAISREEKANNVEEELDSSPHLSHYSHLRKSCGCLGGVSSGGGLFITFQCRQLNM